MDEIYEIYRFFPLKITEPDFSRYIEHHISHLQKCIENKLFSSGYPHLHILYMIFVYIQLLRISQKDNDKKEKAKKEGNKIKTDFEMCWIGLPSQEKDFLKNPSSPFSFSRINEKTVFRFFRLIDFDDGTIGDISSLVNKRNNSLHANGKIFIKNEDDFYHQFSEYLNKMNIVIHNQKLFLETIYNSIIQNFPSDYKITNDDIESYFSIPYFFSEIELQILANNKTDIVSKYILENYN